VREVQSGEISAVAEKTFASDRELEGVKMRISIAVKAVNSKVGSICGLRLV
jgi:hypothetical protein